MNFRQITITGTILFLFAAIGTLLVAYTFDATEEQIALNERETLLRKLHQLVPADSHDNVLLEDTLTVRNRALLGTDEPVTVYRARMAGKPVAVVLSPIAPDGYSGTIKLLVGINSDGQLTGVRVVAHRETPGLGDGIEEERSDWILGFNGKSLWHPALGRWRVKRDGGDFDQLTGATITPRAIVKAVKQCLLYFQQHKATLFAEKEPGK